MGSVSRTPASCCRSAGRRAVAANGSPSAMSPLGCAIHLRGGCAIDQPRHKLGEEEEEGASARGGEVKEGGGGDGGGGEEEKGVVNEEEEAERAGGKGWGDLSIDGQKEASLAT